MSLTNCGMVISGLLAKYKDVFLKQIHSEDAGILTLYLFSRCSVLLSANDSGLKP